MELNIKKLDLLNLLKWSQGIVERRGTMPILANLLLETTGGGIRVTATDLEIALTTEGKAEVKTQGKAVINARSLYEMIKEAPQEMIHLKRGQGEGVEVTSGKSRFRVVGMNPDEFPALPKVSSSEKVSIDVAELEAMIEKTLYAASTDETRYTLNGLYLTRTTSGDKNLLRLVATDGHRLAYDEREAAGRWHTAKGIIIPRKGLSEVRNLLTEGDGEMTVETDDKAILFQRGQVCLFIRLIEGEFPNYEQVIPKKMERVVSVERGAMTGALKRASIMTSEAGRGVKFAFSQGSLEISSSHPDLGEAKDEIEIDYKGSNFQVGFNPRYFLDVLNVLEDEKLVLELKDEVSPCLIRSEFDRGFLALVMPMRI